MKTDNNVSWSLQSCSLSISSNFDIPVASMLALKYVSLKTAME